MQSCETVTRLAETGITEGPKLVSIVMPCLNEAETLATCIRKALSAIAQAGVAGEVIVADNGSTDGSQQITLAEGARLVPVAARGYGAALLGGIEAASGTYILMADADDSYKFEHLTRFLNALQNGADLVMGNRFKGEIEPNAMPFLHRYLGNPVLSWLGRLFFGTPVGDFHCGIRAFSKEAIKRLNLRTTGMEFASEMVVKASLMGLNIAEVPTTLSPDGRSRPPHLRTWRDGWRHLRFLLLYSPRWLFLYPGAILSIIGLTAAVWLFPHERSIGNLHFDVGTLAYALASLLIGFHTCAFAVSAKVFGISEGLLPPDPRFDRWFKYLNLEIGVAAGLLLLAAGFGDALYSVCNWAQADFGPLSPSISVRSSLPAAAAMMLGIEIILTSFFLSLLGMKRR